MKVVAIVQARTGSTRLPNKVMKPINDKTMIELLLSRLSNSKMIDEIVVATTNQENDQALAELVDDLGYRVFRGSQLDVLDRYLGAAEMAGAEVVVRITGDCPLIDPDVVDECVRKFFSAKVDYLSNTQPPSFPDGLDTEVFSLTALRIAHLEAIDIYQREHVTPYLRSEEKFLKAKIESLVDYSARRWTVDEQSDFDVVSQVFDYFAPNIDFPWTDILALEETHPELFRANYGLVRNEGASMNTGQKLWRRAKKVIPGGNMLLSKRPEMFLPEQWPTYFERAKGCRVWDLDGSEFIDMSIMGIGTNILGYGNDEVDDAVRRVVDKGNMSTLNCPEEVWLAEKLVQMHPWADMVRFARSGGEANSIAIRIARAATGKSKVAICGYHGWHDWYLAANLGDEKNLEGHLLPGLAPSGVPSELRGTVLPFSYNDFEALEAIVSNHDVGVIKMEVSRNFGPKDGFLQKVRNLATSRGIVLIFDECTSGFRQSFGGLHKVFGVDPDMAMFGKAMGNGYAITAVIGRREVMESAQNSFISSTFWTERIGPVAALKTLEVMERIKSWETVSRIGAEVAEQWKVIAARHSVPISVSGISALPIFSFAGDQALEYKTLLTQEMLARGFLASTSLYASIAHSKELLESYFENIDSVFQLLKKCEDGLDVGSLLQGPVAHTGFSRLN